MVEASREVFWEIPSVLRVMFYIAAAVSLLSFAAGSWFKVKIWLKGKDDPMDQVSRQGALGLIWMSVRYLFSGDCLLARRVFAKNALRGVMLIFVYWGFVILFVGTLIVAVDYDLGLKILRGPFYLWYSLVLDIAGGLALLSLSFYLLRRYVFSRKAVVSSWDDAFVLVLMFLIVLSGFSIEGIRLARLAPPGMDWSPVGAAFAALFRLLAGDGDALRPLYISIWLLHGLSVFTFIAYLPFSKQFHMFAAQITTMEATTRKSGLKEVVHG